MVNLSEVIKPGQFEPMSVEEAKQAILENIRNRNRVLKQFPKKLTQLDKTIYDKETFIAPIDIRKGDLQFHDE